MFQCSNDTQLDLKWYPLRLVHQSAGPGIIARTSAVAKSGYFAKIIRLRLRIFSWICMQTVSSATHHQQRNKLRSDENWHNLVLCWNSCQCRLRHDVASLRHLSCSQRLNWRQKLAKMCHPLEKGPKIRRSRGKERLEMVKSWLEAGHETEARWCWHLSSSFRSLAREKISSKVLP